MKTSNVHQKSKEASSVPPKKGQLNFTGVVARALRNSILLSTKDSARVLSVVEAGRIFGVKARGLRPPLAEFGKLGTLFRQCHLEEGSAVFCGFFYENHQFFEVSETTKTEDSLTLNFFKEPALAVL
jgi:hypothetical protein